jgi:hypothetical protein
MVKKKLSVANNPFQSNAVAEKRSSTGWISFFKETVIQE